MQREKVQVQKWYVLNFQIWAIRDEGIKIKYVHLSSRNGVGNKTRNSRNRKCRIWLHPWIPPCAIRWWEYCCQWHWNGRVPIFSIFCSLEHTIWIRHSSGYFRILKRLCIKQKQRIQNKYRDNASTPLPLSVIVQYGFMGSWSNGCKGGIWIPQPEFDSHRAPDHARSWMTVLGKSSTLCHTIDGGLLLY